MKTDLYQELGVARDATPEQLAKAYRLKAKQTHPDTDPQNPRLAESFRKLAEAYAILSDPELRKEYDETGQIPEQGSAARREENVQSCIDFCMTEAEQRFQAGFFSTPLEALRAVLQQSRDEIEKKRRSAASELEKLTAQAAHWKREGDGRDYIGVNLERRKHSAQEEMNGASAAVAVFDLAITEVGSYRYEGPVGRRRGGFVEEYLSVEDLCFLKKHFNSPFER